MSESVSPPPKGRGFSFSIRSPRDFWGGLVLVAVAILAIWASRELPGQRGFAFGPGTAPSAGGRALIVDVSPQIARRARLAEGHAARCREVLHYR